VVVSPGVFLRSKKEKPSWPVRHKWAVNSTGILDF
jgi:hypothetical protein